MSPMSTPGGPRSRAARNPIAGRRSRCRTGRPCRVAGTVRLRRPGLGTARVDAREPTQRPGPASTDRRPGWLPLLAVDHGDRSGGGRVVRRRATPAAAQRGTAPPRTCRPTGRASYLQRTTIDRRPRPTSSHVVQESALQTGALVLGGLDWTLGSRSSGVVRHRPRRPDALLADDQLRDRQPREQPAARPGLPDRRAGRADRGVRSGRRRRVLPGPGGAAGRRSEPATPGPARGRWDLAATAASSARGRRAGLPPGQRDHRRSRRPPARPGTTREVSRRRGASTAVSRLEETVRGEVSVTRLEAGIATGGRSHLADGRGGLGRGATRRGGGVATSTCCRPTRVWASGPMTGAPSSGATGADRVRSDLPDRPAATTWCATTPKTVDRWTSLWRMHPGGTILSVAAFGDVVVATTSRARGWWPTPTPAYGCGRCGPRRRRLLVTGPGRRPAGRGGRCGGQRAGGRSADRRGGLAAAAWRPGQRPAGGERRGGRRLRRRRRHHGVRRRHR